MISIFKNINRFAGRWKSLDMLGIFFARFIPYFLIIFLFFYAVYISNLYLFFYAVLSGVLARTLNEFVHLFYKKQRPAYLEQTKVLIPVPKNYSFPSGHSSFFFAISFFLFFYNFYLAILFIIISFLIGVARVFCGVHWFRDVIAGIIVGLLSALIIFYLL